MAPRHHSTIYKEKVEIRIEFLDGTKFDIVGLERIIEAGLSDCGYEFDTVEVITREE